MGHPTKTPTAARINHSLARCFTSASKIEPRVPPFRCFVLCGESQHSTAQHSTEYTDRTLHRAQYTEPTAARTMAPCVSTKNALNVAWKNDVIQTLSFLLSIFALFMKRNFAFFYFFEILVGHTMKKKR